MKASDAAAYHYCLQVGLRHYPDVVIMAKQEYGADTELALQCIAEVVNYYELKRLPRWGYVIQAVQVDNGVVTFVHADLSRHAQ